MRHTSPMRTIEVLRDDKLSVTERRCYVSDLDGVPPPEEWDDTIFQLFACAMCRCAMGGVQARGRWTVGIDAERGGVLVVENQGGLHRAWTVEPVTLRDDVIPTATWELTDSLDARSRALFKTSHD